MPRAGLAGEVAECLRQQLPPAARLRRRVREYLPAARQWVGEQWEVASSPDEGDPYRAQAGDEEDLAQVVAYLLARQRADGSEGPASPGASCEEVTGLASERVTHLLRVLVHAWPGRSRG